MMARLAATAAVITATANRSVLLKVSENFPTPIAMWPASCNAPAPAKTVHTVSHTQALCDRFAAMISE